VRAGSLDPSLLTPFVLPPLFSSNLVELLIIQGVIYHDSIYCAFFPALVFYLFPDFGISFRFQLYCLALCTDSFHRTDQPLSF
jgi:hypothetical protein